MPDSKRAAIVTGSSRGIGAAIALRLLESGYRVALNYSSDDKQAAATLEKLRRLDADTLMIKADISKSDEAVSLMSQAIKAFGRLDVLVNNAALVIDGS